jgi:hypothetical protein
MLGSLRRIQLRHQRLLRCIIKNIAMENLTSPFSKLFLRIIFNRKSISRIFQNSSQEYFENFYGNMSTITFLLLHLICAFN